MAGGSLFSDLLESRAPSWVKGSVRVRGLYCDMVIYNKYILGLCPCFWHRAPKTLGISEVMGVIKLSFVMLV